ncbi:MAG: RluA family pseudouridine synthase [Deltaproteobacteria bacterium]
MSDTIELVVEAQHAGDRLDRTLAALVPDSSRTTLKKHIEQGAVLVDGEAPARGAKTKLEAGQKIVYTPPPPEPIELEPEDIPLSILFEDAHYLAVDKPAGLVVHPAVGHPSGTLVNAVLHHVGTLEGATGDVRPGIVHRLDRGTTGVIVIAKHVRAHELLAAAFAERRIKKTYLAVARGDVRPPQDTIDTFYGRHPTQRQKFSSRVAAGKRAVTEYEVLESFGTASLVQIQLHTGRTHQIRVHLADRGHPLVGDTTYGRQAHAIGRPALHAYRLAFTHPIEGSEVALEAPIPEDLGALIDSLRRGE